MFLRQVIKIIQVKFKTAYTISVQVMHLHFNHALGF